jgi:hypothetical protein
MVEDPHEIILEHLRYLRSRADSTDTAVRELKSVVLGLREDVNGLRGDILRQERALAAVEVDIDRIKARLDLEGPPSQ